MHYENLIQFEEHRLHEVSKSLILYTSMTAKIIFNRNEVFTLKEVGKTCIST